MKFQLQAKGWSKLIHPDDRERVMDSYVSCLKDEGECFEEEYRIRRKDGDFSHFIDRAFLLRDEHGAPHRWIGAITDITERKASEEELKQSENRFRSFIESAPDAIFVQTKRLLSRMSTRPPRSYSELIRRIDF